MLRDPSLSSIWNATTEKRGNGLLSTKMTCEVHTATSTTGAIRTTGSTTSFITEATNVRIGIAYRAGPSSDSGIIGVPVCGMYLFWVLAEVVFVFSVR